MRNQHSISHCCSDSASAVGLKSNFFIAWQLATSGNIFGYHYGGGGCCWHLVGGGSGMLLNILQCTGQPSTVKEWFGHKCQYYNVRNTRLEDKMWPNWSQYKINTKTKASQLSRNSTKMVYDPYTYFVNTERDDQSCGVGREARLSITWSLGNDTRENSVEMNTSVQMRSNVDLIWATRSNLPLKLVLFSYMNWLVFVCFS